MKTFIRQCFCKSNGVEFVCEDKFDASSIDLLYCPKCSDRAELGSLILDLEEVYEQTIGIWAIKFNDSVLKEQDEDFRDQDEYYKDLFRSGKITFKFLKDDLEHHKVAIYGVKKIPARELAEYSIEKDERKKHDIKAVKKLN